MEILREFPTVESVKSKKVAFLNLQLLPIKLHYLTAYGAFGGVMPFLPIVIKSLGINASFVGVIFTMLPFAVFFMKPSFGVLTDHFKNIRCVIIILVFVTITSLTLILLIHPIQSTISGTSFKCGDNHSIVTLPVAYNSSCVDQQSTQIVMCETTTNMCAPSDGEMQKSQEHFGLICDSRNNKSYLNFTLNIQKDVENSQTEEMIPSSNFGILKVNERTSTSAICSRIVKDIATSVSCSRISKGCIFLLAESSVYVYNTYQFWTVLFLVIMGGTCSAAMATLTDAACYEILGDRPEDYGKQRLWATVSWGFIGLLTGYLNDLKSLRSSSPEYSPGFFLMLAMAILDIVLLFSVLNLKMTAFSSNIFKDIGRLFASHDVILFAISVFLIGVFCGLLWTYEFWFLQTLGASQTLLGLTVTVQCLFTEVPFFFFSGWIIKKLGHSLCLIMTFAAFSLRFFFYSVLINPWYVLLIDLLHGWTFGIFFATMTSFAKQNAPKGAEATMQGVLGALFEGLGVGVGSLLGGAGFDKIGGHKTFLWAAFVSSSCVLIFFVSGFLFRSRSVLKITVTQIQRKGGANVNGICWTTFDSFQNLSDLEREREEQNSQTKRLSNGVEKHSTLKSLT